MAVNNQRALYGILMLIFMFFVMILIFAAFTINAFKNEGEDFASKKGGGKEKIGVIEVNGVIMESKTTIELLERAQNNKAVKAIVMRINSPGGAVAPTQEIYQEMRRLDDLYTSSKGEEGKPVYASFGSVAASGGYYLGAGARRIYSNPGTVTGSIGVIMQFMDLHKLYEFVKINPTTIKSGRYKDMGQPNRPMTAEEIQLLESTVADVHEQFRDDILKMRKDKIKSDFNELSQGQIFSGRQALEYGLVDKLLGLHEAAREIHKELKLEGEFDLLFIKKKKKVDWAEIFEEMEGILKGLKALIATQTNSSVLFQ